MSGEGADRSTDTQHGLLRFLQYLTNKPTLYSSLKKTQYV